MTEQLSACCKAPVRVMGDENETTRYYACSCCQYACDLKVPDPPVSKPVPASLDDHGK